MVAIVASSLLLSGCWVFSVFPLYDNESVDFDGSLLGEWRNPSSGCSLIIAAASEPSYAVQYTAPPARPDTDLDGDGCAINYGSTASFTGRLVRIGGGDFLDLSPSSRSEPESHLLPVHSLYKVVLRGDSLALLPMNPTWLQNEMQEGNTTVPVLGEAAKTSDVLYLAAPTPELQEFVRSHSNDPKAFIELPSLTFRRRSD